MKTAHILYDNYLLPDGSGMSVGGIQTYLTNLKDVLKDLGYNVIIYQRADKDFCKKVDDTLEVYGCSRPLKKVRGLKEQLYGFARPKINPETDILIFGSDSNIVKVDKGIISFAIQHGISWDVPTQKLSRWEYVYFYAKKQYQALRLSRTIKLVDYLICVDCNFINWYKALVPSLQMKMYYIPNFSEVPDTIVEKPSIQEGINVIFARRFFPKRGTRLFMNVATRILDKYDNVHITIAGEGPDEGLMKEKLCHYSNVHFIRYNSQDSLMIHADKHIAVVPTLGSEGTSLSLLEAMAAGCAVICTNVGGMTNIVINKFNGLMISPDEDELFEALEQLINDEDFRIRLAETGRQTVMTSFSLSEWKNSWKEVLKKI